MCGWGDGIMIELRLNQENFEYDIYSLLKAFYPKEVIGKNLKEAEMILDIQYKEYEIIVTIKKREEKSDMAAEERKTAAKTISIKGIEKKECKNLLKKAVYELLQEETKKELPWGTLTGIRPTKIPFALFQQKKSEEEIISYMRDTYLASQKKIAMSIEIAKREQEILKEIDYKDGYSLYVGIPFCPSRCLYCSFTSYPLAAWEKHVGEYMKALEREICFVAEVMKEKHLNTIYIGGGTPTSLNPEQLEQLLKTLTERFDLQYNQEFTVEAGRPDSITREKLMVLKKYGVTRISVNPQTMRQKTLDFIGRKHTVQQTKEAFWLARECGFDNINMDLIMGLLGETREDMEYTMEEIKKLKPDSLTVHALAIKRASRLNELREEYKDYVSVHDEEIVQMTERYAREMELAPYYLYRQKNMAGNLENVGYASLDIKKAGIYNILMMEEKQDIIALGAGSISKRVYPNGQIERCENVKDVSQYIERIEEMIERKRVLLED